MKTLRPFLFILLFLPAAKAQLSVSAPETVSERRIARTIFEYTMRAKVTNAGKALASLSATVTSTSPRTTVVQGAVSFGNVGPAATAESISTFSIAHDRTVPFDPAVLRWTFQQPFIVSSYTPQASASEVGVTVRPQVVFSKPVDPASLTSNTLYASFAGQKLPATITPSNDGTFAWLFFTNPMPGASQVQITVDGASIRRKGGTELLDATGTSTPGSKLTFDFSTVSVAPVPGSTLSGRIADPGPDLLPRTADDVFFTASGVNYLYPLAGVKVYVIGQETKVAYTDATGSFRLENMPVGNVKVVLDGRTATNPPAGYYFPEMVIDTTFYPGTDNAVMFARDSDGNLMRDENGVPVPARTMYLPRVASSILTPVTSSQPTIVTLRPEAALNLPPEQQQYLKVEVPAGSLLNNGQPVTNAQVGISVVPPELVRDMLPPGVLQHTFDITVQAPGITNFATPAPMTFPNVFNAAPGSKQQFLSFDHTTGRLVFEGTATVSADGLSVHTDPGTGITHPGWHGLAPPGKPAKPPRPPLCSGSSAPAPAAGGVEDCIAAAERKANKLSLFTFGIAAIESTRCAGTTIFKCRAVPLDCPAATFDGLLCIARAMAAEVLALEYITITLNQEIKNCLNPPCGPAGQPRALQIIGTPGMIQPAAATAAAATGDPVADQIIARLEQIRAVINDSTLSDVQRFDQVNALLGEMNSLGGGNAAEYLRNATIQIETALGADGNEAQPLQKPNAVLYVANILQADGTIFKIRGKTAGEGQYEIFVAEGAQVENIRFYDPVTTEVGIAFPYASPSASFRFPHPTWLKLPVTAPDADGDGLPDFIEEVYGTSNSKRDTDNDGISDLAEIEQGLDPLGGNSFATGVIANLPLAGEAKEVVIEGSTANSTQQTAYVAAGLGGLAIVNAARFQQPILLSRLALSGDATDVAVDSALQIAAVAAGSGGLHIVNVSDPLNPALLRTISTTANQVEVVDGIAYATTGSVIYAFNLLTGERLQVLSPGSANITGLAREGSILFAMDSGNVLRAIDIGGPGMVARGSITMPAGGGKLFVGGGIAYVAAGNGNNAGFATANVSNPNALQLISGVDAANIEGDAVAANGSGLAVTVGSVRGPGAEFINALDVVNVSDPANTGAFITRFDLPAKPYSVAIGSGIAFVASGTAGLQVVNYRFFNNQGVAPTVSVNTAAMDVDATKPEIQVYDGSLVAVPVQVSDDVQVRNVELLLDGVVVQNDVAFPYDLRAAMPTLASGATTATVQVRATDTGGNIGLSPLLTLRIVADTVAPTIVSVDPTNGQARGLAFRTMTIRFSEPMDFSAYNPSDFSLSGPTGTSRRRRCNLSTTAPA